jgi:hypothetical protein
MNVLPNLNLDGKIENVTRDLAMMEGVMRYVIDPKACESRYSKTTSAALESVTKGLYDMRMALYNIRDEIDISDEIRSN